MQAYEAVVLFHPDLEIDLDKAIKKIDGLISKAGGEVLYQETWGKRKLAYQINKQEYAVYCYYEIQLKKQDLGELQAALNLADEVIRYLFSKPTPNFGDRNRKSVDSDEDKNKDDQDQAEAKPKATKTSSKTTKSKSKQEED